MPKTDMELTIWESPPSFKWPLLAILLAVLGCGCTLVVVGSTFLSEPDVLISSIIQSSEINHNTLKCRVGSMNLCSTLSHVNKDQAEILGSWSYAQALFVSGVGFTDIVITFLTVLGVMKGFKPMVFLGLCLIPFTLGMKWKLLDLCLYHESPYHEGIKDQLIQMYRTRYTLGSNSTDAYTRLFNAISASAKCCGVRSYEDARKSPKIVVTANHEYEYPPVCCVNNATKRSSFVTSVQGKVCEFTEGSGYIQSEGCYVTVFNIVYENFGKHLTALLLFAIALQSLQTTLSVVNLLSHTKAKLAASITNMQLQEKKRSRQSVNTQPDKLKTRITNIIKMKPPQPREPSQELYGSAI